MNVVGYYTLWSVRRSGVCFVSVFFVFTGVCISRSLLLVLELGLGLYCGGGSGVDVLCWLEGEGGGLGLTNSYRNKVRTDGWTDGRTDAQTSQSI